MIAPLVANGVSENDYSLYGAGSALGFVRMAACALGEPYSIQKVAEYHAYTGISAARTAIDAIAVWCNLVLNLGLKSGIQISMTKKAFRKQVSNASPGIATYVQALADLAGKIDDHRNRAQHREGLAVRYKFSRNPKHLTGWYLAPMGLCGDHTTDLPLVDLLNGWAEEIEENLREIHKVLVTSSDDMQEAEQLLARLSKFKSSSDTGCE